MARTLTSANAILLFSVDGLFPVPQQIQGFATEDIFEAEAIDNAETAMGVDGKLSAGWVPNPVKLGITLQADSESVDFFEQVYLAQQAVRETYVWNGTIFLRAVQKKFAMHRGFMTNYKPLPDGKKILQPRKFMLTFEAVTPSAT